MSVLERSTLSTNTPKSLWFNRDYMLLWSGQIVSSIGSQVSLFAFPWLILTLTGMPAQAGLSSAIRFLPYLFFGLLAGALVDRWNRKWVMFVCDIGCAIALGSIPVAFLLGVLTVEQIYLVSFVEGTLFIFYGAAESAILPSVVERKQLPAAVAQHEFIYSIASLAGPALGGFLYSFGRVVPFVVDTISYAISAFSLFLVRPKFQKPRENVENRAIHVEIVEGITWLWKHRIMCFLAVQMTVLNASCSGYLLILLVWAQEFQLSSTITGVIIACGGIGSIIGAFLASRLAQQVPFGRLFTGATWVWVITWLPFAFPINGWIMGIMMTLTFIIIPIYSSTHRAYRLLHIPDHLQGRVNTVFRLILFAGQALSVALTGVLLQVVGPVWTVLIFFVPQFVMALLTSGYKELRESRMDELE